MISWAIVCYIPVVAKEVAGGADFLGGVADVHARNVAVHSSDAVEEDEEADDGWDHKHGGIKSKPCKIKRYFNSVVVADGINRLEFKHLLEGRPLREEVVPHATRGLQSTL